jgi:epoxyqueuosine reductase
MKQRTKYRDLDEIKSSPAAERKLPWWIKEVDKPTVEIDWSRMQRFDCSNIMFVNGFAQAVGPDNAMKVGERAAETSTKSIIKKERGFTLRDKSLVAAAWLTSLVTMEQSFLGPNVPIPFTMSGIPDELEYPRYEGTPEENTRMVRAAAKLFGAASAGVVELDENTRKLFYSFDGWEGRKVEFEDVDKAYETKKKKVIPYKAQWVIVYTIRMSPPTIATAPAALTTAASAMGYSEGTSVQLRLQHFINRLGYQCLADGNMGTSGNSPGFGVLAAEVGAPGTSFQGNHRFAPCPHQADRCRHFPLLPRLQEVRRVLSLPCPQYGDRTHMGGTGTMEQPRSQGILREGTQLFFTLAETGRA